MCKILVYIELRRFKSGKLFRKIENNFICYINKNFQCSLDKQDI